MAIIRPGHIVGAISGNLQGSNFVLGKYGPYVRKRLVRTKKATEDQLARRAYLTRLLLHWQNLTSQQRDAWNAAAKIVLFSNRLGIPRHITGQQFFIRDNIRNFHIATPYNLPPPNLFRPTPPTLLVFSASAAGAIALSWTMVAPPNSAILYLYGCRPMSSSPTAYLNAFKYFWHFPCVTGIRNDVFTARWDSAFGHPAQGEKIGLRVALTSTAYIIPDKYPVSTITVA